jgi:hypothetical protein
VLVRSSLFFPVSANGPKSTSRVHWTTLKMTSLQCPLKILIIVFRFLNDPSEASYVFQDRESCSEKLGPLAPGSRTSSIFGRESNRLFYPHISFENSLVAQTEARKTSLLVNKSSDSSTATSKETPIRRKQNTCSKRSFDHQQK